MAGAVKYEDTFLAQRAEAILGNRDLVRRYAPTEDQQELVTFFLRMTEVAGAGVDLSDLGERFAEKLAGARVLLGDSLALCTGCSSVSLDNVIHALSARGVAQEDRRTLMRFFGVQALSAQAITPEDAAQALLRRGDLEKCQDLTRRRFFVPIMDLPSDLTLKILSFLEPRDIARFGRACRATQALVCDDSVWRGVCDRSGYDLTDPEDKEKSCRDICREEVLEESAAWAEELFNASVWIDWKTSSIVWQSYIGKRGTVWRVKLLVLKHLYRCSLKGREDFAGWNAHNVRFLRAGQILTQNQERWGQRVGWFGVAMEGPPLPAVLQQNQVRRPCVATSDCRTELQMLETWIQNGVCEELLLRTLHAQPVVGHRGMSTVDRETLMRYFGVQALVKRGIPLAEAAEALLDECDVAYIPNLAARLQFPILELPGEVVVGILDYLKKDDRLSFGMASRASHATLVLSKPAPQAVVVPAAAVREPVIIRSSIDVGFGYTLCMRGEPGIIPGMSWESEVDLVWEEGEWVFRGTVTEPFDYKFVIRFGQGGGVRWEDYDGNRRYFPG